MKTQIKPVDIAAIRIDGGTQIRAKLDMTVVSDYADAIIDGAEFPPVTIFYDGLDYWLADGFHRFHAYSRAKNKTIPAEIHAGDKRAAWLHALGANAENGLRRSNEDKHKAVHAALEDAELSKWADREIARQCKVSNTMVSGLRKCLSVNVDRYEGEEYAPETRKVERNGTTYDQKVKSVPSHESTAKAEKLTPPAADTSADELAESAHAIESLSEEVEVLKAELAVKHMDATGEEKSQAATIITDLRAEVKNLTVELDAMRISRDGLQRENRELMKQIAIYQRQLKQAQKV